MDDDGWTPDFGILDTNPPTWAAKRPVRIAVLGDFSGGAARGRLDTGAELARRKLIPVEFDTLEDALARLDVTLTLPIGKAGEGVDVAIGELDAFHPDSLYRELPVFKALADLRKRLADTTTFAKAAAEVQKWSGEPKRRASRAGKRRSRSAAPAADAKLSDFARLTGIVPELRTDAPMDDLLRRIVGPFVQPAPDPKRDPLIATVDAALADAMRAVLHHGEFQNLESLWRGVDMLLRRIETGPMLQVMLLDISAEEFAADLSSTSQLSETGLYTLLVDKPSQEKNGGLSLICGLFHFEATPPHTELLGRMATIAQHAGAPFVTAMSADDFADRRRAPHPLVARAMKELRRMPAASQLALLAPRFLLRHPYGKRSDPITAFGFEEFSPNDGLRSMLWGHPAILAACLLAAPTGKTLAIGELPFHYYVDADGDQIALPCTERLFNADTAARLAQFGLVALMAHKGQPELRMAGLDAVDGSALALAGMPKTTARVGITTQVTSRVGPREAPAVAAAAAEATLDDTSAGSDTSASDTSLDDLLASLGGDDAASESTAPANEPAADEASLDPELDALLKSLG